MLDRSCYPKGMNKKSIKKSSDINIIASRIVAKATEESKGDKPVREKNPAAVALGRLGGLKGGKARAASLSPKKRKEIAQKAAKTRWDKKK
jgi:hypothetical protein